jgi:hypothetical protein
MKDFDIFESYKSDTRYPLVAELKIRGSEPVFTYDKHELFENPHLEDWKLNLPWKPASVNSKRLRYDYIKYGCLHGIFFHNEILIEEHHLFLPRQPQAGDLWWWGHNHLQQLLKGLSVRFYAR